MSYQRTDRCSLLSTLIAVTATALFLFATSAPASAQTNTPRPTIANANRGGSQVGGMDTKSSVGFRDEQPQGKAPLRYVPLKERGNRNVGPGNAQRGERGALRVPNNSRTRGLNGGSHFVRVGNNRATSNNGTGRGVAQSKRNPNSFRMDRVGASQAQMD